MEKNATNITTITSPGSPPIPQVKGKVGIPSPNPGRAMNNRGNTSADFVSNAPDFNASDGLRYSTLPTEQKKASVGASSSQIILPAVIGAAIGASAKKENRSKGALLGGILGSSVGIAAPRVAMLKSITKFPKKLIGTTPPLMKQDMSEAIKKVLTAKKNIGDSISKNDIHNVLLNSKRGVNKVLKKDTMEDVLKVFDKLKRKSG